MCVPYIRPNRLYNLFHNTRIIRVRREGIVVIKTCYRAAELPCVSCRISTLFCGNYMFMCVFLVDKLYCNDYMSFPVQNLILLMCVYVCSL